MTTSEHGSNGIGKDLTIYVFLLALAGLQFFLAYQGLGTRQMFTVMLIVALIEASVAALFFMHLWTERRAFLVFVVVFTVAVLLGLQFSWTDSTRMVKGAPYSDVK